MRTAKAEGIIAVANHKLRVESIEDYKEFLSKEYFIVQELEELSLCYACGCIHDGHISKCNFQKCGGKVLNMWREKE